MGICPAFSHVPWHYQSTEGFVISPLQVICGEWDAVDTRKLSCEKNVGLKYMQVNVLKSVTKATKMGGYMRTDRLVDRV